MTKLGCYISEHELETGEHRNSLGRHHMEVEVDS